MKDEWWASVLSEWNELTENHDELKSPLEYINRYKEDEATGVIIPLSVLKGVLDHDRARVVILKRLVEEGRKEMVGRMRKNGINSPFVNRIVSELTTLSHTLLERDVTSTLLVTGLVEGKNVQGHNWQGTTGEDSV